jgi:superfamily II DNA/RNA helicase
MVLFATDIAARGLDFPTVDWVVQVRAAIHHTPLLCHVVESP